MEFDILNQLLTSTVYDLFTTSDTTVYESKSKVKELQGLLKHQTQKRNASNDSRLSNVSDNSSRANNQQRVLPQCKTVSQWMTVQAPKRLRQSLVKLGIQQILLRTRRSELDSIIDAMSIQNLTAEKKKVKNQLRNYDNDFDALFSRVPSHQQKQPFRPLYVYYKKLKQFLNKRGVKQMSTQTIQNKIAAIKYERRQLRDKIERYQQEFQETNNRKIRYVKDIQPIDQEYKKYKDLKAQLQRYEEMLKQ